MTATDTRRAPEGVTLAPAPARKERRWLRAAAPWLAVGAVAALAAAWLLAITEPETDRALSVRNPFENGSRALGEVLRDHGVDVREVDELVKTGIREPAQTTLVITFPAALSRSQISDLLTYPGDLVFIGTDSEVIRWIFPGADIRFQGATVTRTAGCADEDAAGAGTIAVQGQLIAAPRATVCFADGDGYGGYAVANRDGHRTVVIADPALIFNEGIANDGNAALALRALGHHPHLVWYSAAFYDPTQATWSGKEPGQADANVTTDLLPRWTGAAITALLITLFCAALWRGRRMGALVREPLPVVVQAAEATRGRARLYRRARATGRASAALRAASALRMGSRLGLQPGAEAKVVVASVARASGRRLEDVERLLYGPPPRDEAAMMDLVSGLDALEDEVRRR